ncbi:hypothetical protein DRQ21_06580 [Candidatus Fermentibacteria bacterium]|nr:MAG: hypothetical protein DRQ21_06580 [Candidatus Fermentibacteria bacterium]
MNDTVTKQDGDMISLVSIFHFVLGGFQMLFSLVGLVYVAIGAMMASGAMESTKGNPPPPELGWIFGGVGVVFVLVFITVGFLTIRTGINIRRRRRRTFCMVIDSILCLMVPFGTIVGIFGLVLLTKAETVKEFEG